MNPDRPNYAPEIKLALTDVTRVLDALGLLGQGRERQRQAGGWVIRCPVHEDRSPSCSVQLSEGLLVWKCHGCEATGDVLTLIAAARGLSVRRDFRAVLAEGARLAGLWAIVDALEGRGGTPAPLARAAPRPAQESPPRDWPDAGQVAALWAACGPVGADGAVAAHLAGRALDPDRVDALELARSVPATGALPRWAVCRLGSWRDAGYRLVVPMFDAGGELRSLRAWRVVAGNGPKRLPPFGHKASGLVMADEFGRAMLRGTRAPERVVVAEGEPDWLTWATRLNDPSTAVIGIVSGSWTASLGGRFPVGARVDVRTDCDAAGDRYALEIEHSLRRRCFVHWTRRAA